MVLLLNLILSVMNLYENEVGTNDFFENDITLLMKSD